MRPLFSRSEPWETVRKYLRGLLSFIPRKNSWQLAESVGYQTPHAIQHLLGRALWNPDELRDLLQDEVLENLADPNAVLILDETGFLKKGKHSAGVQRQYSGTAGRIENCQVGVLLAYATPKGCAFLDRELYLPQCWIDDPERCRRAKVPAEKTFATKVQLGVQMLDRLFDSERNIPFQWVVADEVYSTLTMRNFLETHKVNYVLAVRKNQRIRVNGIVSMVESVANSLSDSDWQTLCIGQGMKGERKYRYARVEMDPTDVVIDASLNEAGETEAEFHQKNAAEFSGDRAHWLLIRESLDESKERAYYWVHAPQQTTLQETSEAAGSRWWIEGSIESSKGETGLDEYEVRSYHGWYRHITLSLLAHALLVILRARNHPSAGEKFDNQDPSKESEDGNQSPQLNRSGNESALKKSV